MRSSSKERGEACEVDRLPRGCLSPSRIGSSPLAQWADPESIFGGTDRSQRACCPDPIDGDYPPVDLGLKGRRAVQGPTPIIGMRPTNNVRLRDYHWAKLIDQCRHERFPRCQSGHIETRLRARERATSLLRHLGNGRRGCDRLPGSYIRNNYGIRGHRRGGGYWQAKVCIFYADLCKGSQPFLCRLR
jgi:hypothetical protein